MHNAGMALMLRAAMNLVDDTRDEWRHTATPADDRRSRRQARRSRRGQTN